MPVPRDLPSGPPPRRLAEARGVARMSGPRGAASPEVGPGSHLPIRPVPLAHLQPVRGGPSRRTGGSAIPGGALLRPKTEPEGGPRPPVSPPSALFRPICLDDSPAATSTPVVARPGPTPDDLDHIRVESESNDSAFEDSSSTCSRTTPLNHSRLRNRKWRQLSCPGGVRIKREIRMDTSGGGGIEPISIETSRQDSGYLSGGPLSAPGSFFAHSFRSSSSGASPLSQLHPSVPSPTSPASLVSRHSPNPLSLIGSGATPPLPFIPPFTPTPPSPVVSPEPSRLSPFLSPNAVLPPGLLHPFHPLNYRWPPADPLSSPLYFCPGISYPPSFMWNPALFRLYPSAHHPNLPFDPTDGRNGIPSPYLGSESLISPPVSSQSARNRHSVTPSTSTISDMTGLPESPLEVKPSWAECSHRVQSSADSLPDRQSSARNFRECDEKNDHLNPSNATGRHTYSAIHANPPGDCKIEVEDHVHTYLKKENDSNLDMSDNALPTTSVAACSTQGLEVLSQVIDNIQGSQAQSAPTHKETHRGCSQRRLSGLDVLCDAANSVEIEESNSPRQATSAPTSPVMFSSTSIRSKSLDSSRAERLMETGSLSDGSPKKRHNSYTSPKAEKHAKAFLASKAHPRLNSSESESAGKMSPSGRQSSEVSRQELAVRQSMANIQRKYQEKYKQLFKLQYQCLKRSPKGAKSLPTESNEKMANPPEKAYDELDVKKPNRPLSISEKLRTIWRPKSKKIDALEAHKESRPIQIGGKTSKSNGKRSSETLCRWEVLASPSGQDGGLKKSLKFKSSAPSPFQNLLRLTGKDPVGHNSGPSNLETSQTAESTPHKPCDEPNQDLVKPSSSQSTEGEPKPCANSSEQPTTSSMALAAEEIGRATPPDESHSSGSKPFATGVVLKTSIKSSFECGLIEDLNSEKVRKKSKKTKKDRHKDDDPSELSSRHSHRHKSKKTKKSLKKDKERHKGTKESSSTSSPTPGPNRGSSLHESDLKTDVRILFRMEGYFYPGKIQEISPPDIYGILVDHERGNKPHILSREDILNDVILDISAPSIDWIPFGTRVCAFWSKKYHHLFPGTVGDPELVDARLGKDFINIELDDGDSRDIHISDVRLLPVSYPLVEYDMVGALSNRRRRKNSFEATSSEPSPVKKSRVIPIPVAVPSSTGSKESLKVTLSVKTHDLKARPVQHLKVSLKDPPLEREHPRKDKEKGISAFLPSQQLWNWSDVPDKPASKRGGRAKTVHKSIARKKEHLSIGDCAVFLSTGRPDRPFIGRLDAMWESSNGNKRVRVKWFYHAAETEGLGQGGKRIQDLTLPGALFESMHYDENDLQTISHRCEVLPVDEFRRKVQGDPKKLDKIYENNDLYYLAGQYDPVEGIIDFASRVLPS